MLSSVSNHSLSLEAEGPDDTTFTVQFSPGVAVQGTIALSHVAASGRDDGLSVRAYVESTQAYVEGHPTPPTNRGSNWVHVENCAAITFRLFGERVSATALISIFVFERSPFVISTVKDEVGRALVAQYAVKGP